MDIVKPEGKQGGRWIIYIYGIWQILDVQKCIDMGHFLLLLFYNWPFHDFTAFTIWRYICKYDQFLLLSKMFYFKTRTFNNDDISIEYMKIWACIQEKDFINYISAKQICDTQIGLKLLRQEIVHIKL